MSRSFDTIAQERGLEELRLPSNGLRVLLLPQVEVPVVTVCVVYHVGSRNEATGHTGATHLLEHLLFKGSQRFDPARGRSMARELERVGAGFNATTWFDRTSYYEVLPAEHLELALEIETDRMRSALLREEDLVSERTVVLNEFEQGENDPFDVLLKLSFATAFREHPYHHPTIGWRSDIEHVGVDRLRAFYDTFYQPDNATLILVGCFERQTALDAIWRHFGSIPPSPQSVPPLHVVEPPQEGERRFVVRRSAELGWVACSWRTPEATHPDTHALSVLADILSGGVTSRLHQRLVETGSCVDVQATAWQLRDPGLFQVFATLNGSSDHAAVEHTILQELQAIATGGVSAEELERAIAQVEADVAYHRDSPAAVAGALAESVACADWRFYLSLLDHVQRVSREDVQRVAATYFSEDARTVGWFVPKPQASSAAATRPRDHAGPLRCHLKSNVAARLATATLGGGARVVLMERHHNPTVHVQGSFLAGPGLFPMEAWSAASLLPDMLERGTAHHDRLALARRLEDRGIQLGIAGDALGQMEVLVAGSCLAAHLPVLLEIMVEVLREPTFPADELEKLRQLRLGELALASEETFLRAYDAFSRLVFPPGHPSFRRTVAARREGLLRTTREDLLALHRAAVGPASLVLVLVGDFQTEGAVALLERLFLGWEGGVTACPQVARVRPEDRPPGQCFEWMEDKPNLNVVLGHAGNLRRDDPDYVAAILGNSVLGESTLSSRLGARLRDQEGLTYGIISRFFGASLVDGPWAVSFSVGAEHLERALEVVREEITRFVEFGPTEAEVEDEKRAWAGSYTVTLADPTGLGGNLLRLVRHGRPLTEIDTFPQEILATDRHAVEEAVRRHLYPERLSVAVAGSLIDRQRVEG
ncbi:MAG: insulinase family protein [Thermoanaerobaculaceae bacterium]|nr:insulinase family protein [Thermoanaerobaculaceae bacterium]